MKKLYTFIIALLLVVTITWLFIVLPKPKSAPQPLSTEGIVIESLPNVPIHAITLLDSPHVSEASGHPHIPPFGVVGEDIYLFDGMMKINGTHYNLRLDGYAPIAAVELNSHLYVVAQGFFNWNMKGFLFLMSDPQNRFEQLHIKQLPKEMWRLRFEDDDQTCTYRTWLLRELSEHVSHANAIECFETLFKLNPRFGFLEKWRSDETTSFGEDISWFVERVIERDRNLNALPAVERMLELARATDDPKLIATFCETITKLDPARATELICKFKSSVPDLSNEDDARAKVFRSFPFLKELNCAPTTQSVENVEP